MLNTQELARLIASATSSDDIDSSYKSLQELVRIIASCVAIDEETGEPYIRVQQIEE